MSKISESHADKNDEEFDIKPNSPSWIALKFFGENFDEHGSTVKFSMEQIYHSLKGVDDSIRMGKIEQAIQLLCESGFLKKDTEEEDYGKMREVYYATDVGYSEWEEEIKGNGGDESATTQERNAEYWQPLPVENYTELSQEANEIADSLEKENGYMAEHPLEAELTIETTRSFANSIQTNEGKSIKGRFMDLLHKMERVLAIFEKASRIGVRVVKFTETIKALLFG